MEKNNRLQIDHEEEIDLLELWYLFLEKFKWIFLAAAAAAIISGIFTHFFIPNKYQATSKLYIVSSSSGSVVNLSDLQLGTSLTADYKELVLSRPMLESTIQNLQLSDMTAADLKKMISVSNPSSTRILCITVTSTIPQQAADIANEMARLAKTWLSETMESSIPNIVEDAVAPDKKSSPSLSKNTLMGGMVGAIICYGLFVAQFLMDETVRTPEDFEKYFGIMPLASIPQEDSVDYGDNDSTMKKTFIRKNNPKNKH